MKKISITCAVLLAVGMATTAKAQINTAESIIQYTVQKINIIENNYRLVEKTFSDFFYDTTRFDDNRTFIYRLYSSNRYTFTAFAPPSLVEDVNVLIIRNKGNNQYEIVASDRVTASSIQFSYTPTLSGDYYIAVSCRFKTATIKQSRFGLIIDREL